MTLHVGDTVIWRNAWGTGAPALAKVTELEYTGGSKYGEPYESLPWAVVTGRNAIVTLDNNHWAWAHQIAPAPEEVTK